MFYSLLGISSDKISGDVFINNRKGKKLRHFEIKISIPWQGSFNDFILCVIVNYIPVFKAKVAQGDSQKTIEGKIDIPEISNDVDETDYEVILFRNF